ncbi:MAG: endonuclease [Clostridia bacterium]|nr:endonuclease [Clostridia bacterium]
MKKERKRIALILALIMTFAAVFSLIPSDSNAAGTYNTGNRHTVATSLSSQASSYYTGNYTYSNLSTKGAAEIKSSLETLMSTTLTNSVTYSSLTTYWKTTDASNGTSGTILFYSDTVSSSYNREHVWPKSRGSFLKQDAGCDLHHLRPTNSTANSTRSNYTFGYVRDVLSDYSTYSYGGKTVLYYNSSSDLVEVNDNIKGDVARILLYVHVCWDEPNLFENVSNPVIGPSDDANNGKKVIESLDTLLEWMEMDPVDTWEMSRNDMIEDIQGNRNVFIDYPEYAWLIFGLDVPEDYTTPSGNAGTSASPSTSPSATPTPTPSPTPTPTPTSGTFLLGDVDGNGRIEANDAAGILRHVVQIKQLDDEALKRADVDKISGVSSGDASVILRFIVQLIPSLG